ncbi:hypothetical protein M0802_003453 [Mischocyttarus mexicanus]|nr:hypothetical protein M0802_003453 [Mischocyttarus mexicanus]
MLANEERVQRESKVGCNTPARVVILLPILHQRLPRASQLPLLSPISTISTLLRPEQMFAPCCHEQIVVQTSRPSV